MTTVNEFYAGLAGDWQGTYRLWLRPDMPAQVSDITANVRPVAAGHYYFMNYSWKRDGERQEGVFFLGGAGKTATATWGDSFHMVPEPMNCRGELTGNGTKLILNGSYSAGEGPAWGWRTEFTPQGADSLLMEAYNITPDGREAPAVRAELKRRPHQK